MTDIWHVLPTTDAIEHDPSDDCVCGPQTVPLPTAGGDMWWAYLHYPLTAADLGREEYIQQIQAWAARQEAA